MEQGSNTRIAKNTILLYFRMLVTMGVSLYTSRVILEKLGVDEYGIYQAVAGVVGMFAFLNSALATGTSRFITYSLGENDLFKLKNVFSVSLSLHVFMALIIFFLAETLGLYLLYNKIVLPEERMNIILGVYQLSVLSAVVAIIQVPYSADIISHEHMNIYAYMSILDVVMKLLIVYVLSICNYDKLLVYSLLLLLVSFIVFLVNYLYCRKKFPETKFILCKEKKLYKDIGSFSGWSLWSATSTMLANQGIIILLNNFFSPAIVSARAISIQVNNVINQFVQNFRTAVNPQIVKSYSQNETERSSFLVLVSTKISFYMIMVIGMPVLLNADTLLRLWLVEVPPYSVIFLQLIIIQSFFQTIDTSLYYGLYACGKIKMNAVISPLIAFIGFPICFFLFKMGMSPISMSWCYIVIFAIIACTVKPFLLRKYAKYKTSEIAYTFYHCLYVFVPSILFYFLFDSLVKQRMNEIIYLIVSSVLSMLLVMICAYFFGIEKDIRERLLSVIINKIKK